MGAQHLEMIDLAMSLIKAGALMLARPLGFLVMFPVFTWMGLRGMVRNAIALALAAPLLGEAYAVLYLEGREIEAQMLGVLAAKEFLVGLALGVILGAPFWAAETAGTYIDVYRGTSSATVVSPEADTDTLVSGAIFSLAMVAIFLVSGGMRLVVGALYESYGFWPLFEPLPQLVGPLYPMFTAILSKVFKLALALGAPIMIAMFLGELALALSSRFAAQVNVFDASLSIKNLIFLFVLPPYLYMLARFYAADALDIEGLMAIIREALG